MELFWPIFACTFIGYCVGYFGSKKVFKISTIVSVFLGLMVIYFGWSTQQTQAGDMWAGIGAVLGVMVSFVIIFSLGGFWLGMCAGRAFRE